MSPSFGVIVLAAGSSERMGRPKQLIESDGVSLVRRAAEAALDSGASVVVIVLGAASEKCAPELAGLPLTIVLNEAWASGIGTSLRLGVRALPATVDAVVVTLADQPAVGPDVIARLVEAHRPPDVLIVASEYGGTRGVPALFARAVFDELLAVPDESGAKAVIAADPSRVCAVPVSAAALDLDTPDDVRAWQRSPAAHSMTVRPLTLDDIEDFVAFHVAHGAESGQDGDPYFGPYDRNDPYPVAGAFERTRERWTRSLDALGWRRAWGLFHGSALVGAGSVTGGDLAASLHRADLGMGILRGHRGQGGGRLLLEAIVAWCRAQPSIDWIDLGVIGENPIAMSLYLKAGFTTVGCTPDAWRLDGHAVDETHMTLGVSR